MSTTAPDLPTRRIRSLMTLAETAAALRKKESQLRWMIAQNSAPPHAKVGGRIMFDADGVAAWLDDQFTEAS
ncbi:helix-turn-helix domain-containing protein [Curtobacterium flaccumfaciens pv. flaccumfaciens]|uniref:helix-turn-helix domain-containing protein n=1 Tax=Curtobacterium flaccumfaciens TaxID=2035 RepID=UPI001BDE4E5B|nr:helix-turn-helix domain-containing protein [Curtobacterium flaccumfaciens]MBT1668536.1 helix-turn-helix domain-containing protein [Curtobacterium flaccumfaciens pv. flaccumfaciens]